MQFTGQELTIKRNFYTQINDVGMSLECSVDNTTGVYHFGLSGLQGIVDFRLESGRMFFNNQFIHSYRAFQPFSLVAQIGSGANVIKDGAALVYGQPTNTGSFDYFYFQRDNAGMGAVFDLNISGDTTPSFSITDKGYLFSSGQRGVTGYFVNQGAFPIKVFNSNILATQNYTFGKLANTINVANTGIFAYSGDFNTIDFTQPILTTFNTNFGNLDILFTIVDTRTFDRFVLLQEIIPSFNTSGVLNQDVNYLNYSGGFVTDAFNTQLYFSLGYISGSGTQADSSFLPTYPYVTVGYGNFLESGRLTGQYRFPTGNGIVSGEYIVNLNVFSWATGAATGFFSGNGTGLATGINYTGAATSAFTGLFIANIQDGSGTFVNTSRLSGTPVGPAYSLGFTGYNDATGFINTDGLWLNDVIYIGSLTSPIVKGFQFTSNQTLAAYLSGAPIHQVNGIVNSGIVQLTSLIDGTAGNGLIVTSGDCNIGSLSASRFLTGGYNVGSTGVVVVQSGNYSAVIPLTITGSGSYAVPLSGSTTGAFYYARTFTGVWDILTGINSDALVSLKIPGGFNDNTISGSGVFPPNSFVNLQVVYYDDGIGSDSASLTISGAEVLEPLIYTLSQ